MPEQVPISDIMSGRRSTGVFATPAHRARLTRRCCLHRTFQGVFRELQTHRSRCEPDHENTPRGGRHA